MTVLFVIDRLTNSGAPRTAVAWLKGLGGLGHDCILATVAEGADELPAPDCCSRVRLDVPAAPGRVGRVARLRRLAMRVHADTVVSFGTELGLEAALAGVLLRRRTQVLTVLNLLPQDGAHLRYAPSWCFPRVGHVVTVNGLFRSLYLERYGFKPEEVTNIDERYELEAFLASRTATPAQPEHDLLCLRRLDVRKVGGAVGLVRFLRRLGRPLPGITVSFVGGGDHAELVEDELARGWQGTEPPRWRFLGVRSDIPTLIARSRVIAGSERCLVEAMAIGRPPLLLDDEGPVGFITRREFDDARATNFTRRPVRDDRLEETFLTTLGSGVLPDPVGLDQVRLLEARVGVERLQSMLLSGAGRPVSRGRAAVRVGLAMVWLAAAKARQRMRSQARERRTVGPEKHGNVPERSKEQQQNA